MNIEQLIEIVRADELYIWETAALHGIDPLTLRSCLLLHLPQFEEFNLRAELEKVVLDVKHRQGDYSELLNPPPEIPTLDQLEFVRLDSATARIFHENFHYVGSFRPGEHFAMTFKGKIVCIGSIAPRDLKFISEPAMTYTRFFVFRWGPKNAFTYFQSKLRKYLIKNYDTNLMVTFINPNIGFTGKSHCLPWEIYAYEHGTEYYYIDGKYRTMRYVKTNKTPFVLNKIPLNPLVVLVNKLQPRKARLLVPEQPHIFQRPSISSLYSAQS